MPIHHLPITFQKSSTLWAGCFCKVDKTAQFPRLLKRGDTIFNELMNLDISFRREYGGFAYE